MENRREFLRKAGFLAGSFGLWNDVSSAVEAAVSILPENGSTYLDAEHIVLLMQENRSFDHSFGTLKGVRGFNDPRAVKLPNGNPVWLQSSREGKTFAPFRLDIKNSKATWTSYLPHSWENQIGAWNKGRYDRWLDWKRSGHKAYQNIPLTLGYYTREDIPFYYAFADAFTICDQHFCSSLTGTTTNRHFFWTGKCTPEDGAKPLVRNSDVYFNKMATWKTFPERLQEHGISWKVYQNEISLQNAAGGKDEGLLGNFTDNNLEWFEQYQVRYKKSHIDFYRQRLTELPAEIVELESQIPLSDDRNALQKQLKQKRQQIISFTREVENFNESKYAQLDAFTQQLHQRAFQTNEGDAHYHQTETVSYQGEDIRVPKGDVLYQFRKDVEEGNLPTVSWICAPQYFSDHPSAPMYGAWYVSEILNILTKNPEVWKKTIFILNYDENDGYFDHVPPFVAPKPEDESTGKVSKGLGIVAEYVTRKQELDSGFSEKNATEGPVGLGYRVPLIVASPWSRGGWVNSEVFDITSTIQFLEHFVEQKFGKRIVEDNISSWRRAITGDLTSVFRPFDPSEKFYFGDFVDRNQQIFDINQAKNKPLPDGFHPFSDVEVQEITTGKTHPKLPVQERGTKPSNALRYELYVHQKWHSDKIELQFAASNRFFGTTALGAGFNVYNIVQEDDFFRSYTVASGEDLSETWSKSGRYGLHVYGPNGFLRTFEGDVNEPEVIVQCHYNKQGNILLKFLNYGDKDVVIVLEDGYNRMSKKLSVRKKKELQVAIDTGKFYRWYDITVSVGSWKRQFAGRVENGLTSITDPMMA
ncbi:phospholipase C, phosphocholine-specific [Sphingobacterium sp. SGG-5]|uniref:phosphocholine-specific phospholipase C n=1 Tax=Sphingobacterium sp. SGG-5 TaxID=2710881 RepID=UPI0013EA51BB|nr:phospholipase C, phosphocholine-specific [Sphingobacterium sp. SGG-5]NGM63324.1 phospholipase C, phosphocholine-specific [Sphingobacterium sp. SGG-5]